MTEEEIGTKAIKFIDEHEEDCLTGFVMMRKFAYEVAKELENENSELKTTIERKDKILIQKMQVIEELQDENIELEKEISNLLSCKNCPDNKGGLLCQKEYEDKCLTQKIQYIKELKEENVELQNDKDTLIGQIIELKKIKSITVCNQDYIDLEDKLVKAKELLRKCNNIYVYDVSVRIEIEQFLKEIE